MRLKTNLIILSLTILFFAQDVFARGGGGGSGGGGGGGGGGFGGGGYSSGGGNTPPWFFLIYVVIFLAFIIFKIYAAKVQKQLDASKEREISQHEGLDIGAFKTEFETLFYAFQQAWATFDLPKMQTLVTEEYYKRMVLELNVLKNENRADLMNEVKIFNTAIIGEELDEENQAELIVKVTASAQDVLMDTKNNQQLFYDPSSFTEFWHLEKHNGQWRLDYITQETENPNMTEGEIKLFAQANGFYYDADFGWLMMPNKGVLFKQTNFGKSDINNHVIGYYRDKIVEFYTYIPNPNNTLKGNYLIAQAILPKAYGNILVKKKSFIEWPKWGLKRMTLESGDFNKKFSVWAENQDQVNSLELLTPNFMEKIYTLPFELNIEIVGNILYFYTKARGAANYPQMLEIISWAFDEMKI